HRPHRPQPAERHGRRDRRRPHGGAHPLPSRAAQRRRRQGELRSVSQAGAKDVWTIGKVLTWTTQHFADRGIDSPRLDAELLLAHVLKQKRVYLYTHFDKPLSQDERDAYRAVVQRRARREPLAYIVGEREFY